MTDITGWWEESPVEDWPELDCKDGVSREVRYIRCGPDMARELEFEFSSEELPTRTVNFDTRPPPKGLMGIVCVEPENSREFGYDWNEAWVVLPVEQFDELESVIDGNEWALYCPSEDLCYTNLSIHPSLPKDSDRVLYDTNDWSELGRYRDYDLQIMEVPDMFLARSLARGPADNSELAARFL